MIRELLEHGILQSGLFQNGNGTSPYRLRLEMLPAYPQFLGEISRQVVRHMSEVQVDRIVADADATPIGVLVSVATGIPLVYSRGRGEPPVHDLVGAYDVGHPAILLVGQHSGENSTLITNCARVGLEVQRMIPLIGDASIDGVVPVTPIMRFSEMIQAAAVDGLIPEQQAQAILAYAD